MDGKIEELKGRTRSRVTSPTTPRPQEWDPRPGRPPASSCKVKQKVEDSEGLGRGQIDRASKKSLRGSTPTSSVTVRPPPTCPGAAAPSREELG